MEAQVCTQCQNTTFRFDKRLHAVVCAVCGQELNTVSRATQMLEYDQYRVKAIAFVKARDYNSAKPLLESMRNIKPDDPDIYYLHLMGLTDCCKDLALINSTTASIASNHWETFMALGGDGNIFYRYMNRRKESLSALYNKTKRKTATLLIACIIGILLSLAFIGQGNYFFLLGVAACVFAIYKTNSIKKLYRCIKTISKIESAETPFFIV